MRPFMRYTLLGIAMVCTIIFTGCMSQRAGAGPGAVVVEAALEPLLDPAFELAYASNEYRVVKHRWPKDYDELSNFLKQTGNKKYSLFLAVKYHRIDFAETADGKLRIEADYTFDSVGKFNSGGTFHSNGTGQIEGMVVSPFDPRKMPLPPDTTLEPTATAP
jgi:hypothetical protein